MNNRNGNKIWAVCLILLMLMSTFVMIANAAETEPNNGMPTADQIVPATPMTGDVNSTAGDPIDFWNITLTGGATAANRLRLDVTITKIFQAAGTGWINVTQPTDNGYNFAVAKFTIFDNGVYHFDMNATATGSYFVEILGGDFDYSIVPAALVSGANANFDDNENFSTADALTPTGSNGFTDCHDYVDIYKFTTVASDIVMINFTGAAIGNVASISGFYFLDNATKLAPTWGAAATKTDASTFYNVSFTGHAGTFFIVLNAPTWAMPASGTYAWTAKISTPAANKIPALSAKAITPSTIKNTQDNNVLFSINAVDSDGTVKNVTVACSALWTGEWYMTKGTGNAWSVTKKILMANISATELGNQSVTFKAIDNDVEYNTTTMNLTVIQGNLAPTSDYNVTTPYAISVAEDSGNYLKNLTDLVDDEDAANLTFEVGTGATFSDVYNGVNISVEIQGTWMNVTLEDDGYGVERFTVNATDGEFYILFNVTFTITSVNDKPIWGHIEKVVPAGTDVSIVWGENTTLDVDEDTVYNFTLVATDVDGDALTYDSNISSKDNFAVDENGNVTFTPSQADIGTGVAYALWYVEFDVYDASSTLTPANKTTVVFNISNVNDVPEKAVIAYAITDADAKQAGNNNLTVKFTITAPADEDGDNNFTYKFYWNNGTTADTTETHNEATFVIEHTYAAAGLYIVKVVVDDQNGGTNTSYSVEINVSAPNLKPVPEQWIMGWKTADKTGDAAVEITFGVCTVTVKTEKDKPAAGKTTTTTTYAFSGTCGTDVTVIYLYVATQKNTDEYTYYAFTDLNAPTEKVEITPESGAWSWSSTYTFAYDTPAPTTGGGTPSTDVYTTWYSAVGWTADGTFNWAEKKVAAPISGDDDTDDDSSPVMMYGIIGGVVLLVIIIVVVIIVIMMMKKKKAAAQTPPAPAPGTEGQPAPGAGPVGPEAQAPVMCQCGNQIPVGSLNCPVCGAPAPAPAPAAAPQVDQYGQPTQQQQPPMDQQPQMQQAPPQGYPQQQQAPPQGYPPQQQQAQPGYPQQQQPGYPPQQ